MKTSQLESAIPASLTNADAAARRSVWRAMAVLLLGGAAVFYVVGFAPQALAHNAAHDVRHVTVKPCH